MMVRAAGAAPETPLDRERPHVVHVIPALAIGGAEAIVAALAVERHRRGWPTEVVALLPAGQPDPHRFVDELRAQGVTVHPVRSARRGYWTERAAMRARTAAGRVVVHSHKFRSNWAAYLGTARPPNALVATVHGYTRTTGRGGAYQWLDRQLLRRFDAVIAVSADLGNRLVASGLAGKRVHVVHNAPRPVELLSRRVARSRLGIDPSSRVVGWVGRLSFEKGPDLLLESVRTAALGFDVVLIGDGPERARLEESIARLGLSHRVRLVGAKPRAAELLPAFDLLAVSSRDEGCPTVILEAMAAAVPIVAFAVGGIPELITQETARLVRPGDVAGFGAALRAGLDDPPGTTGRATLASSAAAERFDSARWLDAVERVYDVSRGREAP